MPKVEEMQNRVMGLWRPPPRLRLSEWADRHFYLSAESAAEPGRWHTLPYQRGIMDAISDPEVERVSVKKSARVGYTKILNATVAYYAHHDPCPIMVVQPTIDDAKEYSKEEIAPMLRDCPEIGALFSDPKAKDSDGTMLHKVFRGGLLHMVGANSPRGFRRVSRKVIIFDEIDGYPPSAGAEGDQIKLGIRRSEYYWDRKIIDGSTPTIAGKSRIDESFELGDQRHFYVPCPECDHKQVLKFSQFKWPKGQPELAEYCCEACGSLIDHKHKRWMIEEADRRQRAGEPGIGWVAHAPENFTRRRHASFHIWAAYSYSPNATWGQICAEFVDAERSGPEQLKTWVNTVRGESWTDRGEAPDWQRLYDRREKFPLGTVPAGGLFLTCGVDVQKDRFEFEVVAWGRGKTSWSVDAGVIMADTADMAQWGKLDDLLGRVFPHESGVQMPVSILAVDSGYNTQQVYGWARRHPMSRVIAVKGVATSTVLIGTPSPVDVTISGRRLSRGYKVWPIGVNVAKAELYGWLHLQKPPDDSGEPPPAGYCHFPEYGEEYFKQITAEQLIPHKKRSGFIRMEWELIPGRQNHGLDRRVYARAAAAVFGIDRFGEKEWAQLEEATAQGKPRPPAPATPRGAGADGAGKKWIERRPGGFIRRGR